MNNHIKDIEEKINKMSDDELVEIISNEYSFYTDEALIIAKKIAEEKGLSSFIKDKQESMRIQNLEKEDEIVRQNKLKVENRDDDNLFIFAPTTGRVIFCVLFTLIAISRIQIYQDDPVRSISSYTALVTIVFLVWGSVYRLFPWSKKGLIVEGNRIVFGIREGKKKEVIEPVELVKLSKNGNVMTVEGLNNYGIRVIRNIEGKYLKKKDYEIIKIILKDKIES